MLHDDMLRLVGLTLRRIRVERRMVSGVKFRVSDLELGECVRWQELLDGFVAVAQTNSPGNFSKWGM